MKKKCLLLFCMILTIFSFAQKENEISVIKYSALDSQISIKRGLSIQLEKAFAVKRKKPDHLLLTNMNKTDLNSINKWLMLKKKQSIYRVDLSAFMSKYIGETEKNLDRVFNNAELNNWILFFDEADALFGKRTSVKEAHDKYANQEVSYFLKKIKKHIGLVIINCPAKDCSSLSKTRKFKIISSAN